MNRKGGGLSIMVKSDWIKRTVEVTCEEKTEEDMLMI